MTLVDGEPVERQSSLSPSMRHPGIDLVVIALADHRARIEAVRRVKDFLPEVRIAAAAAYPDEVAALRAAGVDVAGNLLSEAGEGLADDASDLLLC